MDETPEIRFELSVLKDGDSLVRIGPDPYQQPTYYGEYTEALDAIKKQCKLFIEEDNS